MTESDNPPSEARPLETEPLVIERLESPFEPPVPSRPGDRRRWAHLYGSGKGLAIAAAARRHRGPCLVIVPNAAEAGRIADEVRFFGGEGLEPLAFPDWETLPLRTAPLGVKRVDLGPRGGRIVFQAHRKPLRYRCDQAIANEKTL